MSVRKRKWTSGNGEQEAWIVDYVDGAGSRRQKTFERKKDADAFHAKARVEVREGTHVAERASISVAAAGDLWIQSAEAACLERTTIDQYRQHLKFHINPFIGRVLLCKLNVAAVRAFEDRLRSEGRSPIMIRKVLGSLGALIGDAQERGLANGNPVRDMRGRRRRGKERQASARQRGRLVVGADIPTRDEVRSIVRASQAIGGRTAALLITAIFTGLRASELRGLTWADIDFTKGELHVRQRADRYNEIGPPKSGAGNRVVPLAPIVMNTLREWQLICPRPRLSTRDEKGRPVQEPFKPEHLVFPNGRGKVESLGNIINRVLTTVQVNAGVVIRAVDKEGAPALKAKYTGMHALRHFYASWCINRREDGGLGLPAKMVQERMGHSSIVMTMDRYGHLFRSLDHSEELAAAERSLLLVGSA